MSLFQAAKAKIDRQFGFDTATWGAFLPKKSDFWQLSNPFQVLSDRLLGRQAARQATELAPENYYVWNRLGMGIK